MIYTYTKYLIQLTWLSFLLGLSSYAWCADIVKDKEEVLVNVTLQFELVDGLIVVQASKDGLPGNYIFDTGAPRLMVNQKVDDEDFHLWTVKGSQKGEKIDVSTFEYGTILAQDVEAWAMDLTYLEEMIGRPVAGILGHNLLKGYSVEIDYQLNEISFIIDRNAYKNSTDNYEITSLSISSYADHLPIVELKIDGEIKKLVFDTGAAISVLDQVDATQSIQLYASMPITINHIKIDNAPFCVKDISELTSKPGSEIDGILSVSSLDAAKVLIDHNSKRVFLFWTKEKA